MKAWAATDQARKADQARQAGQDPTPHERRNRAYEQDARQYAEHALEEDALDPRRVRKLLDGMRDERETEVGTVLARAGVLGQ